MEPDSDGWVVGVDLGGTKTQIAVADGHGVLVDIVVKSPEWEAYGWERVPGWLMGELDSAFPDWRASSVVVVGAHGCDSPENIDVLSRSLAREFSGVCRVLNDAMLLVPAAGRRAGIGMVMGTGSVAVAFDGPAEGLVVGGWGWILGDQGSAPGIVREALRAVLARHDDGLPLEQLGAALVTAFGATSIEELLVTASQVTGKQAWGERAPIVFQSASDGSELAQQVIDDAARSLAGHVGQLVARGANADTLVMGGGVARHQPALTEAVARHVRAAHGDVEIVVLQVDPVAGALALARDAIGAPPFVSVVASAVHPVGDWADSRSDGG